MPWNNADPGPWGSPGGSSPGGGNRGDNRNGDSGNGRGPGGPQGGPKGGPKGGPQGGPQGGPHGPWGSGPGGPPDLDEIIARIQAWVRQLLSGGRPGGIQGNGRLIALAAVAVAAIWLVTGFYRVQPDEQGVVLRFGAYVRTTLPGLNYHLPWPIESVERPAVTRINRIEVGYRSQGADVTRAGAAQPARDVPAESLMLTGDENIVDINFAVFWHIRDAGDFLFNTRDPETTVRSVAESVMREVIAQTPIEMALTQRRAQIEQTAMRTTQAILDAYKAGVEITQVQLLKVDPPAAVIDSFRDVQRATTDAERMRNEAESYRNDIVPRARGDAARIVAEAEGARQATIAQARGETQRFDSVLKAYDAAKDITLRRMYIETMQDILSHAPTVVIDDTLKGLTPLLPLGGLNRILPPPAPAATPGAEAAPAARGTAP